MLATGNSLKGVPYVSGGTTPAGFDCSGFTQYVYGQNGVSLPRVASAQAAYAQPISPEAAVPGDLVFFHSGSDVYHVGIYAGNGTVLHAPRTGRVVSTEKIWTNSVTYGRVL